MANNDLLQRTLAQIEAHPETWNQNRWARRTACGTAYCFAGTALALTYPDMRPVYFNNSLATNEVVLNPGAEVREHVYVRDHAMRLLDLDDMDAGELFHEDNTLDDLRLMVADLIAGRPLNAYAAARAADED